VGTYEATTLWSAVTTESPDVMRFLRHVISLCFPDNIGDLFNHTDGRYATSPLALIDLLYRLQRLLTGGCVYIIHHYSHHLAVST